MVEVVVEKLIWRGRGLGRLLSGKKAIILPPVLPSERILGKITKEKKDYVEIEPVKILAPSKYRRPHPCALSHECGGCRFGIIQDEYELKLKKEVFIREFQRSLGKDFYPYSDKDIKVFPSPVKWGYRWRGQVFILNGKPHFKKLNTHKLVEINKCLLFASPLNERLKKRFNISLQKITISASPYNFKVFTELDEDKLILPYKKYNINLKIHPSAFFQANWDLNQDLVDFVVSAANKFDSIADLYAGCGNFSVPLATLNKKVIAVENDNRALKSLEDIKKNMRLNLIVENMDLRKNLPISLIKKHNVECVIVDPPRTGGPRFVEKLIRCKKLKRIIWVSCDIVNSARDLRPILKAGWEITDIALFDMFPKTYHMEAILILNKN